MPEASLMTPVGVVTIVESGGCLARVTWRAAEAGSLSPLLRTALGRLEGYFAGEPLAVSDLPLAPAPTAFQARIRTALCTLARGTIITYGALARDLGTSPRAVGTACGRNPLPLFVPCHRVVGAGHQPRGFSGAGGIATQRQLLALESITLAGVR